LVNEFNGVFYSDPSFLDMHFQPLLHTLVATRHTFACACTKAPLIVPLTSQLFDLEESLSPHIAMVEQPHTRIGWQGNVLNNCQPSHGAFWMAQQAHAGGQRLGS
jgi:hypothetical protein